MHRLKEALDHVPPGVKITGDGLGIGVLVGTLTDHLPAVAATTTILWTLIRIYETKTVQNLLPCKKK